MRTPPNKPTQPFGTINFGKDGSVKPSFDRLSNEKERQELGAMERFVAQFNEGEASRLMRICEQLPPPDNDFLVELAGKEVEVELTELVDRSFLKAMTVEEYHAARWTKAVLKFPGELPLRIDHDEWDNALTESIRSKVGRAYATNPNRPLWLVVFSTYPYETESVSAGEPQRSEGLCRARRYLAQPNRIPFAEIWFYNLLTRPVRVWPCPPDAMVATPECAPPPGKKEHRIMVLPTAMQVVKRGRASE